MSEYIDTDYLGGGEISRRLKQCGAWLLYRHYYRIDEYRLVNANFCMQHILCPLCAIRRGGKAVEAYLKRLEVILQNQPNLKAYLVTLTVKDGQDLDERFRHLNTCVRSYHEQRKSALQGKRQPVEACKAVAAVWSYEFVIGKNSGLWHPHCHAVWLCTEPPSQQELSKEWESLTRDSFIVDVRPLQEDVASGFVEVFKYAVKFSELPFEKNWEAYKTLKGRRLISSFGHFRGVEIPENLLDDPIQNEPYVELFYKYISGEYQLQPGGFDHSNPLKTYSKKPLKIT